MAHHQDAVKRNKQNEVRRVHNRTYRSRLRNQVRRVRAAVDSGDKAEAQAELKTAISVIHRVAGKGIIHRNAAARKISRLNKAVHGME